MPSHVAGTKDERLTGAVDNALREENNGDDRDEG